MTRHGARQTVTGHAAGVIVDAAAAAVAVIVNAGRRRSQAETEVLEVAAAAATEQKTHHGLIIVFVGHVGPVALGQIEVLLLLLLP